MTRKLLHEGVDYKCITMQSEYRVDLNKIVSYAKKCMDIGTRFLPRKSCNFKQGKFKLQI